MEPLTIVIIVILGILIFALFVCMYFLRRNNSVCEFRNKVLSMDSKYCNKIISSGGNYHGHCIYDSMPNYESMLYRRIKKLTLENYLSKEDIDKLNSVI